MNTTIRRAAALLITHPAAPVAVTTELSEAGAWFRWTQRYENASHWVEVRPAISLQ